MLDRRPGSGLMLLLLSWGLLAGGGAQAQDRGVAFDAVVGQPRGLPQLPPQGAWGEVINVDLALDRGPEPLRSAIPDRHRRHPGIPDPLAHQHRLR